MLRIALSMPPLVDALRSLYSMPNVVVFQSDLNKRQALVEELELLLKIIGDVADRFVDAAARGRAAELVLDAERRGVPIPRSIVGLELSGQDPRAEAIAALAEVAGYRPATKIDRAAVGIVAVED